MNVISSQLHPEISDVWIDTNYYRRSDRVLHAVTHKNKEQKVAY